MGVVATYMLQVSFFAVEGAVMSVNFLDIVMRWTVLALPLSIFYITEYMKNGLFFHILVCVSSE